MLARFRMQHGSPAAPRNLCRAIWRQNWGRASSRLFGRFHSCTLARTKNTRNIAAGIWTSPSPEATSAERRGMPRPCSCTAEKMLKEFVVLPNSPSPMLLRRSDTKLQQLMHCCEFRRGEFTSAKQWATAVATGQMGGNHASAKVGWSGRWLAPGCNSREPRAWLSPRPTNF